MRSTYELEWLGKAMHDDRIKSAKQRRLLRSARRDAHPSDALEVYVPVCDCRAQSS